MNTEVEGTKMQFKTDVLKAAVESAITEHKTQRSLEMNARQKKYDDIKAEWVERYNMRWSQAIPAIRKAMRTNEPITHAILPTRDDRYHDAVAVFDDKPPRDETYVVPSDLMTMRNALRLITDETISTTALRELGVRPAMLRTVCELAREETAKQQAKS